MKSALILDEQSPQKLKQQGHPPSLLQPQEQTLDDISPKWARRLKNENIPTYMSLTWLRWRYELQKTSKCVVGEAYGYSLSIWKTVMNAIELVAGFYSTSR